ncbi:MAG TPA: PfkB family carbohydrate kinase [Candidatus Nanopelagicales bacterium]
MTVLVVGEALVDLIVSPDGSLEAVPGGGPFNLARTAARLGVATAFGGGISDDVFGRRIAALLRADDVDTPVTTRTGLNTTLAIAELDASGAASYTFYLDGTAAAELHDGDVIVGDDVDVLAVGTLGLVAEPIAATVERLVAGVADRVLVFVDPNCRPSVISDDAGYRARLERVLARADVVKVSGDDLAYLDADADPVAVARGLLALGPAVVLFTDGGDSVRLLLANEELVVPVPGVDVVDTVGAGDAFGGAFIAFWERDGHHRDDLTDLAKLRSAVERAIVVAGITCTRPGADPPHLAELPA